MLQGNLRVQLLISLAIVSIASTSAAPAPPSLVWKPIYTTDRVWHAWQGWEPGSSFQASMLGTHAQAASEEVHRIADTFPAKITKADRPSCISSLLIKDKGIYSATDYGKMPSSPKATLHPKTQELFDAYGGKTNRYGGYCSCIQALDGFHSKFPDDEIPRGSALVSYGYRGDHPSKKPKFIIPCKGEFGGVNCKKILNDAGIECIDKKRLTPANMETYQEKAKKPRLD